ncbi:MAG: [protein-PII] uridylyltransferase [Fibrobacteria bacterium]|nr:[protein-PII] uridylyltransferase [Fibrobacteria bacterium]
MTLPSQTGQFPLQATENQIVHMDIHGVFTDSLREAVVLHNSKERIQAVKRVLNAQLSIIKQSNRRKGSGGDTVRYITEMVDALIRVIWDQFELQAEPTDKMVALIAVGGYGRMELCPKSDIDLLILTSEKITSTETTQSEAIIRDLWDFGFDVGNSVRSVSQCKAAMLDDPETSTSFLSERFICGNHKLYRLFLKTCTISGRGRRADYFIKYILEERTARIKKYGGLIQLLEPNLKEGNGCIRDVHVLLWLSQLKHQCTTFNDLVREGLLTPQELEDIRSGYDFLLQTRCYLHFLTGKKSDLLLFDIQPDIAREFGFSEEQVLQPVEIFLKFFYRHTRAINRITEAFLSRWQGSSSGNKKLKILHKHPLFKENNGTLDLCSQVGNIFRENIDGMLYYFDLANTTGLTFSNLAFLRLKQAIQALGFSITPEPSHLTRLLELCKRPNKVGRMLRCMHDVGLLDYIFPDFQLIDCHSQHNIYHIYTTDEHTLTVVRQLAYLASTEDDIRSPVRNALAQVKDRDVLIIACFFHDIGKGLPGDHCQSGALRVYQYMKECGFSEDRCKQASLLVRYHLVLNETAQRRNPDDPVTIQDLITKIQSASLLHALYVLTYCDSSSVHPDAWNDWKASMLYILYDRALKALAGETISPKTRQIQAEASIAYAKTQNITKKDFVFHLKNLPTQYESRTSKEVICQHIHMVQKSINHNCVIELTRHHSHYLLTMVAPDNPKLLMTITGSLAQLNFSILSARIYTRMDGVAIDEFNLAFPKKSSLSTKEWEVKLQNLVTKNINLVKTSPDAMFNKIISTPGQTKKQKPLHVPVGVQFSNQRSENYSTLDISCRDQIGLMYKVAKVLNNLNLNIHGASCTTEADTALDAFYISDVFNKKINNKKLIEDIKKHLEKALID